MAGVEQLHEEREDVKADQTADVAHSERGKFEPHQITDIDKVGGEEDEETGERQHPPFRILHSGNQEHKSSAEHADAHQTRQCADDSQRNF